MDETSTLFLSYNGVDRPAVLALQRRIEAAGIRTFLDQRDLPPGLPWAERLEQAIRSSAGVAVFLGAHGRGRWQKREISLALDWQVTRSSDGKGFPVIPVLLPGSPPPEPDFLFQNTWIDLKDDLDHASAIERMLLTLRGEEPTGREQGLQVCPFRGLDPFREEDEFFFFGRKHYIGSLLGLVQTSQLVAVVGPSGSGKSSLVQAGLVPHLHRQRETLWEILTLHPGDDPYRELAWALLEAEGVKDLKEVNSLADGLRKGSSDLTFALEKRLSSKGLGSAGRLLVVLDQFEEILTSSFYDLDPATRHKAASTFVESLLAAQTRMPLTLVFTLRADYGHALALSRRLSDNISFFILGPMSSAEREEAITGPAKRVGLDFAQGLVERILEQVQDEPGGLPLLEYALLELWEKRDGRWLTHEAFQEIGLVRGAISTRADKIYSRFSQEQQRIARRLLIKMVHPPRQRVGASYTRQQMPLTDLKDDERKVINELVKARLLITSSQALEMQSGEAGLEDIVVPSQDAGTVTLAHEALIEGWDKLKKWLRDNSEFLLWQRRMKEACEEWGRRGRKRGYLLSQAELAHARAKGWLAELDKDVKEYIEASQRARTWRVLLMLLAIGVMLFLLQSVAVQKRIAERERQLALARRLTTQAEMIRSERPARLDLALLLGLEALQLFHDLKVVSLEADQVVRRGLSLLAMPVTPALPHGDLVFRVTFRPDGKHLMTTDRKGRVRLWEISTGQDTVVADHDGKTVNAIALNPQGQMLATASQDGSARLWRSGKEIRRFSHGGGVTALALSPDGALLATGSEDGVARVWHTQAGQEIPFEHKGAVTSVAFDQSGQHLLTASLDGTVYLWDVTSRRSLAVFDPGQPVTMAAFGPDDRWIAAACQDNTVRLWEVSTRKEVARLLHKRSVSALSFSPEGRYLATASHDSTAKLLDIRSGQETASFRHEGLINAVAFSPNGHFLATASHDGTARMWEVETGREVTRVSHNGVVFAVAFSKNGQAFATASFDRTARVWRVPSASPLGPVMHSREAKGVAFNPVNGSLITTGFDGYVHFWRSDRGSLRTGWERSGGSVDKTSPILNLAVSPSGRWIASGGLDPLAYVWDAASGRKVAALKHEKAVRDLAFDPAGRRLATASSDRKARVWSIPSGEKLVSMLHPGAVQDVAFGRDGDLLATLCTDGRLRTWETQTGNLLEERPLGRNLRAVAFSPDGRLLAVAGDDAGILVWKVSESRRLSEERVISPAPHAGGAFDLSFDPSGTYLASSGNDSTAKLWSVATGEQVSQMEHSKSVHGLGFSPDGKFLATASDDRTVRLWPVLPEDLISVTCEHLPTRLNRDGWSRYLGSEPYREICQSSPEPASIESQ